jgi:YYY domain-containing protein
LLLGVLLGWALALLIGMSRPKPVPERAQTRSNNWLIEKFVLILLLVGLGLPLVVEFIFLRDNFGFRMNTVFKFYFQAWVLLALASAFAVYFASRNLQFVPALAWWVTMGVLVAGAMVYPVLATLNKANNFQGEPTLNGIAWIAEHRPGDYAAIQWLRQNAFDGSVILEAPGSGYAAYQYTGRISAMTGLPTLLGWGGHQSQWRGNYDEPARREPDIDLLYNTSDLQQAQELLDKYNIIYVYVGPLERERYSPQGLNKFDQIMDVVFQQDDVIIYKR